ncbi:hypothetical protein ABK040_016366 [Willaertia magna]
MQNNNNITLHFKTLNKQSFQINSINPNTTTLTQLKELIAKQEHFDLNSIKLVYKGKDYSDPSFQNLLLLNFPFVNPLNSSSSSSSNNNNNHAKEVIIVVAKKVQPQKKNSGNNLEGDQLSLSSSSSSLSNSNKQQQKQQQHSDKEDNTTTNTTSIPIHFQNKKTTTNNTTNTNNNTTFNHKKMGNTIMGNDESTTSTTNNSSSSTNNNNNTAQNLAPKLTREEQSLLQINAIENEAKKYQEAIQELKGKKGNTELLEENKYNYEKRKLDEYLTRCMLKLDAVEIPNDEIRNKRRMTIQFIQKVIKTIEEEL